MRIDQLLVQRGLAPSRSAAQRLIAAGAVGWRAGAGAPWARPKKAGDEVSEGCELSVTDDAELRWVSRAGLKLEGGLDLAGITLAGVHALDLGQSTGGFTQVMLARGAARVTGVEVGHGQLHPTLREDPRVICLEGLNARALTPAALGDAFPAGGFGFVTGDLSFISLTLVLPAVAPLMAPGAQLLMLVKPQFELQPGDIGKGGLVKDPAAAAVTVRARLEAACRDAGLQPTGWFDSPVTGGDGNHEHLVRARKPAP
jgi:23S rRNA (cytidine1920-2'-O)/16S rRNA (cytidine1409-2'-O)-methyltransferase